MDFGNSGYPCDIVSKLNREIIKQTVKAFTEEKEEEGRVYWLKMYYFAGWSGALMRAYLINSKRNVSKEKKN